MAMRLNAGSMRKTVPAISCRHPALSSSTSHRGGPGVRVDSHCYAGYAVPPYYDSMIAKVIVWAPNRGEAIDRMRTALAGYVIDGIPSTIPFHLALLDTDAFPQKQIQYAMAREEH